MDAEPERLIDIDELARQAGRRLEELGIAQANGQVTARPDIRTLRWYTTVGLLDRPAERRGRRAFYGPHHVAQVVAVKRLQAEGVSLTDIATRLAGLSTAALVAIAHDPAPLTRDPSTDGPAYGGSGTGGSGTDGPAVGGSAVGGIGGSGAGGSRTGGSAVHGPGTGGSGTDGPARGGSGTAGSAVGGSGTGGSATDGPSGGGLGPSPGRARGDDASARSVSPAPAVYRPPAPVGAAVDAASGSGETAAFWSAAPVSRSVGVPGVLAGIALDPTTSVTFAAPRPLTAADVDSLRRAAMPLLDELRRRGLVPVPFHHTDLPKDRLP
jgi:hypothetical protein